MSAETPLPGSETKASHGPGPLTFIAGNIASFSAIGVFTVVVGSTLFLYSYLNVFDWRLIWIIDYSDIFKVGLVALGVLSSVIIIALQVVQMFLGIIRLKQRGKHKEQIWFLSILGVAALAGFVFFQWRHPAPYQLYVVYASSAALLLGFCFAIVPILTDPSFLTTERIVGLFALLMLTGIAAGSTFGTVTKHSTGLRYDVFLKDREMADVRLVLFTSHHTVLYSGDLVIVLPTADIVKLVGHLACPSSSLSISPTLGRHRLNCRRLPTLDLIGAPVKMLIADFEQW
jgi:hypothetical protein